MTIPRLKYLFPMSNGEREDDAIVEARQALQLLPQAYDVAQETAARLMAEGRQQKNARKEAWGYCVGGKLRFSTGDCDRAIEELLQATRIAEELGDLELEGWCFHLLAGCYIEKSEYATAIDYSYRAVFTRRLLPDEESYAASLGGLGSIHGRLGNLREAADCFSHASNIARRLGNQRLQAINLGNMGLLYLRLGAEHDTQGIECLVESTRLARIIGDERLLVNNLTNWATALKQQGRVSMAEPLIDEAIVVAERSGFTRTQLRALIALAHLYLEQQRYHEAEQLLIHINGKAVTEGLIDTLPTIPETWGRLREQQQRFSEARIWLEKAMADAERLGERDQSAEIERHLSRICEALGDFPSALRHFHQFYEKQTALEKQAARNLMVAQKAKADVEHAQQEAEFARKEAELERLRGVELAEANRQKDILLHQLQQHANRLARQAIEDPLTGLYNRRYLTEFLGHEISRSHRHALPLTVLIADLDNFKKVNDTFSHAIGDEVLKITAQMFLLSCRKEDVIARYGGEEFVAVLPETSAAQAMIVAERIRFAIASYQWQSVHPDLRVTVSIGLADEAESQSERLLAIADRRLYEAKSTGKNRVIGPREEERLAGRMPEEGTDFLPSSGSSQTGKPLRDKMRR